MYWSDHTPYDAMNIPNEIAFGAFLVGFTISLAIWIYFLKFRLPRAGTDIEKHVDEKVDARIKDFIDNKLPDIIKKQIPKLIKTVLGDETVKKEAETYIKRFKDDIKEELPDFEAYITRFKTELKDELPDIKAEVTAILKEEGPGFIKMAITGLADRVADPEDREINILLTTLAFQGFGAFRACMAEPEFKKEFDGFINGKMNMVANQLETRLPTILKNLKEKAAKGEIDMGEGGMAGFLGAFIPPELKGFMGGFK